MQTHGFTSSAPGPSLPGRNDTPRDDTWKRASTFHVDGLSCRHCALRVAEALRSIPGVLLASVSLSNDTAYVCHDARLTHEREIIANMAHRGFWLSPALGTSVTKMSWFDAPRLGIVLALVGNLIALAFWKPARTAPRLPWVELAFALLLMLVAAPPLASRAIARAKQGIWGTELIALVAAFSAMLLGFAGLLFGSATIALTPNFLLRLGTRPDGAATLAFEAAGAIVGLAFLGQHVHQAAVRKAFADVDRAVRARYARVRRVVPQAGDVFVPFAVLSLGDRLRVLAGEVVLVDLRLDVAARVVASTGLIEDRAPGQMFFRGERLVSLAATGRIEYLPRIDSSAAADATVVQSAWRIEQQALQREGDRFESMAALALSIASVWFAIFAVIVHALLARHSLHFGVLLAGIAVLVGASPAAFVFGLPLARMVAVLRARAAGAVVNDVSALEALASTNFAYFDLGDNVRLDTHYAFRSLWHRAIACRLLSSDGGEAIHALGHRLGVPATGDLELEDKVRIVQATRDAGGQVVIVGRNDLTARMIPADVFVAIAPGASSNELTAPIILRDANLQSLVWLVDIARSLRSRRRLMLTLTLAYNAIVIPCCVAGFLAPITAAGLCFGLTLVTCFVASRVGLKSRQSFSRDKLAPTQAIPRTMNGLPLDPPRARS